MMKELEENISTAELDYIIIINIKYRVEFYLLKWSRKKIVAAAAAAAAAATHTQRLKQTQLNLLEKLRHEKQIEILERDILGIKSSYLTFK